MPEHFFKARFCDGHIFDVAGSQRFEQALCAAAVQEAGSSFCFFLISDSLKRAQIGRSLNADAFDIGSGKLVHAAARNDRSVADDGCARAVFLNFRKNVV